MNEDKLLREIFNRTQEGGFPEGTEQYGICRKAADLLGFSYKRSEELEDDVTVDCSTLTSQPHWEGALIGIPFVADNQRRAATGMNIASVDSMIPSDVLVKYPSLDASPDKTWNHVGLYLGKDVHDTHAYAPSRLVAWAHVNQKPIRPEVDLSTPGLFL